MKKLIKNYILLYNQKNFVKNTGWQVSLRWDRVKHGFAGDTVKIAVFLYFGIRNNFGENLLFNSETMWWLYYCLIPLFFAFLAGFFKEAYDQQKGGKFDWGDIWVTTLPFVFVYHPVRELLLIAAPQLIKKIEDEILK